MIRINIFSCREIELSMTRGAQAGRLVGASLCTCC